MKVLFIGDIFASPGRRAAKQMMGTLKKEYSFDYCIANGENAAAGAGITSQTAQEIFKMGVDAVTLGNHSWSKREVQNFIDSDSRIIRPANYPDSAPGSGSTIIDDKLGIINLQGRVYMDFMDCPFKAADREISKLKKKVKIIIIDMHAEATSEKAALAWYTDGRVSAVIGTHTHVQTADERILPCGTAFISDAGMTGPYDGIIGVDREIIIARFINRMPSKFEVAQGKVQFNGVFLEVDDKTGKAIKVERIYRLFDLPE